MPTNAALNSAFLKWARDEAKAFDIPESVDQLSDLSFLDQVIAGKDIVALGESAHYLHEWNLLRTRMFQYLVAVHGFKTFVLEIGFVEGKIIHDYVLGADVPWEDVIEAFTNAWGVWAEVQELLQWMRCENASRAEQDKLRFYGMDGSGNWSHANRTYKALHDYLLEVDAPLAKIFAQEFADPLKHLCFENRGEIEEETWKHLGWHASRLINLMERNREAYVDVSSADDFAWNMQNALVLRDQLHCWAETELDFDAGFKTFWNIRDASMAAGLEWVINREGPSRRILVGAHNNHLQQFPVRLNKVTSMGSYLTHRIGRDRTLFICATNGRSAKGDLPIEESNQATYDQVGPDRWFMDFRRAPDDPDIKGWMNAGRLDRSNIRYQPVAPGVAWDCMFFSRSVTIAHAAVPKGLSLEKGQETAEDYPEKVGYYEVIGFLAAINKLTITVEDGALYLDGSTDTSGELYPPFKVRLIRTVDGRFMWDNWPAILEFLDDQRIRITMPGMGTYDGEMKNLSYTIGQD